MKMKVLADAMGMVNDMEAVDPDPYTDAQAKVEVMIGLLKGATA